MKTKPNQITLLLFKGFTVIFFILFLYQCKSTSQSNISYPYVDIICNYKTPLRVHYSSQQHIEKKGDIEIPNNDCLAAKKTSQIIRKSYKANGSWIINQQETNIKYAQGKLFGNKRDGEWKFYTKEGKFRKRVTYQNNTKVTETNYFPGTSHWQKKGKFLENKKSGLWQSRFSEVSPCITQGNYIKGKKDGLWIHCAANQIDMSCVTSGRYNNGDKVGKWKNCKYDSKNKQAYKAIEGNYKYGILDGPVTMFGKSGNIFAQGKKRADRQCLKKIPRGKKKSYCSKSVGHWKFYHSNGNIRSIGNHDNDGRKIDNWKEYYQNEQLYGEGPRKRGRKYGNWTFFKRDGSKIGTFYFKGSESTPKSEKMYKNGVLIAEGGYSPFLVTYSFSKDKLRIRRGKKFRFWKFFHSNGQIKSQGKFMSNKRTGKWEFFDEYLKLIASGKYMNNKKTGLWQEMKNGQMKTIKYFLGRRR